MLPADSPAGNHATRCFVDRYAAFSDIFAT